MGKKELSCINDSILSLRSNFIICIKTIYIYFYQIISLLGLIIKIISCVVLVGWLGFFLAFIFLGPHPLTGGQIRAVGASLHHSHSNTRSKTCLQPTLQLMAMPDP